MSIEIASPPAGLPVTPDRLHRLTLAEYQRLIEAGAFRPSDRLVLLDGFLVDKLTKGPRHSTACGRGYRLIAASLPADWHVRQEQPLVLPGGPEGYGSAPEPDLAVVAGPDGCYVRRHPGPADVALVVEFADSHLPEERRALARYAWARIPIAWIVNLTNDTVEVYTDPTGPGADAHYRGIEFKGHGESLAFALPGDAADGPPRPIGPFDAGVLMPS